MRLGGIAVLVGIAGLLSTSGALHAGESAVSPKALAFLSVDVKPYGNILKEFSAGCGCTVKQVILSGDDPYFDVRREVRQVAPDVILVVGESSYSKLKGIENVPIVYMMPPTARAEVRRNVTAIRMSVSPERQIAAFKGVIRGIRRIGLVYNPANSSEFVREAVTAAAGMGIELLTAEVRRTVEVMPVVRSMEKSIDAFWIIPDETVALPGIVDTLLLFSLESGIPVLTFSNSHVDRGALMSMSVGFESGEAGRQAGRMVKNVLSGESSNAAYAEGGRASINFRVAKNLGIPVK
jgi:putative ABC transport system substrate-binding protein